MKALDQFASAIVHPGPRHRDDFLCCCLIMAAHPMTIECRQPTEAELADKTYLVMDVGGRHEPESGNFDHHQYAGGDCAFVLLLHYLGLYDKFVAVYPWIKFTNVLDTMGPKVAKLQYRMDNYAFGASMSPVERSLLTAFQACSQVTPQSWLGQAMGVIGRDLLSYADRVTTRLDWLKINAGVALVANLTAIVVPRTAVSEQDPALGLDEFRQWLFPDTPALSVTPDPRGSGLALYRYDDHPRVDFTKLAGKPGVIFTHKNGFYATLETADIATALTMAAQALA